MIRFTMYDYILFVAIFLISLESYYSYSISIALLPYIGLVLLLALSIKTRRLNKKHIFIFFIIFIIYATLITLLYSTLDTYTVYISSLLAFIFCAMALLIRPSPEKISKIITVYLYIHSAFFVVQFLAYYLMNIHIDYLYWFNGEVQRTATGSYMIFGKQLFRATGLFVEPSTFFIHYAPLVAIKWLIIDKKLTSENAFFVIVSILTFSAFGFIFWLIVISAYFLYMFFKKKIKLTLSKIFIFLTILVPIYFLKGYVFMFFERKIGLSDNNITETTRIDFLQYIFNRDFIDNIIGVGFNVENSGFVIQDAGLIIYVLYAFGFMGILFFLWMGTLLKSTQARIIFFAVILSKIKLTFPFFWFLYVLLSLNYNGITNMRGKYVKKN